MFKKNNILFITITILFYLLNSTVTNAQTKNSTGDSSSIAGDFDPEGDLEQQLIPLEEIIEIAIENSPYMKYDAAMIENRKNTLKVTKKDWLPDVNAQGMYNWGNQQYLYTSTGNTYNILNGYRYGFTANFPLKDFTTLNARIKKDQAELDASKYKREQTMLMLKRQVIDEYQSLITGQKVMKIRNAGQENARVAYQMVEKQFREASAQLGEVTKANEALMTAETAYQIAVSEFKIMYLSFQELIGVKLSTLKRTK